MQRTETIADGFDAYASIPDRTPAPGLLILQEIFGVNAYIRSVCDRVAALGYTALAPDMFWRLEPGFTVEPSEGEEGMNRAFAKMGEYDQSMAPDDLIAALGHLTGMPECDGRVGVMGFCFGGTLTFLAAATASPDCAVSYYGSGVAGALDDHAGDVDCPLLLHFGDEDPYLPIDDVEKIRARFADVDHVEVAVQPGAGHAFDNDQNPMFSNPTAAAAAWERTRAFLAEHLPVD